jgi:AcrR family transcriptional regulator
MNNHQIEETGYRGPTDHSVREQIVAAANEYFKHFGYGKTTVSDLAKAIGFSKAYIYKFFDSKQAIGQAICSSSLETISAAAAEAITHERTPPDRLRLFFRTIVSSSTRLYFDERKLFEIAELSSIERWPTGTAYQARLLEMLKDILAHGRKRGDFERKTPLDETARASLQAMQPFINPLMLRENLDKLPEASDEVINLILRSLSP